MSVWRLNLRFNLKREVERRAWEYLQGVTRSKNGVIIRAVNAYEGAMTQKEREDAFLERLEQTVREELKSVHVMVAQPRRNVHIPWRGASHTVTSRELVRHKFRWIAGGSARGVALGNMPRPCVLAGAGV